MAVHADQAAAVIHEYGIAIEEKRTGFDDGAGDGHPHRRAGGRRNVHAAVRITRLAVEDAARAEGTAERFYSMSSQLEAERKQYYLHL